MDLQAIAFMCELDGKLRRIGYIVKKILPYVHSALRKAESGICLDQVYYRLVSLWARLFCLCQKGRWPYPVVRAASKR